MFEIKVLGKYSGSRGASEASVVCAGLGFKVQGKDRWHSWWTRERSERCVGSSCGMDVGVAHRLTRVRPLLHMSCHRTPSRGVVASVRCEGEMSDVAVAAADVDASVGSAAAAAVGCGVGAQTAS